MIEYHKYCQKISIIGTLTGFYVRWSVLLNSSCIFLLISDYLKYVDDHHIKNERGIDIECFDKNSTSESPFTNPPLNIPKGGHPTDGHESKNIQIILSIAVVVFVLGLAVFFIIWRKQNALRLRYLSFRHRSSASTSSCSGILAIRNGRKSRFV